MTPHLRTGAPLTAGLAALACLPFATPVAAAPVDQGRAAEVAAHWLQERTGHPHQAWPNPVIGTASPAQTGRYYHVFTMEPDGWAIVAADDVAYPVIAYSPEGTPPDTDAPPAFTAWMTRVNDSIRAAARDAARGAPRQDATAPRVRRAWDHLESRDFKPDPVDAGATDAATLTALAANGTALTAVAPLLTTTWSQGRYYNPLCPIDSTGPDGHALVGCCATAMGQIMKYWSYPAIGTGSKTYSHPTYGTLSANFGATTYNWSAIPAAGYLSSYNTDAATVLSHVGIALNMDYGPTGSGCYSSAFVPALQSYFGYATGGLASRSAFTDAAWITRIKTDIDARRPILYVGSGPAGGHAFVLDGYNDAGYFHFNWGWNGAYDGYYLISNLNPAGYTFNSGQQAVFGITPANAVPAPAAPTALTATAASSAQINLAWTDNSSNETGFRVERRTGSTGDWVQIATAAATTGAGRYADSSAAAATGYSYRVRAFNTGGNSDYSNEATATTPAPCVTTAVTIGIGATASGALASGDCLSTLRPGSYHDDVSLAVTSGQTYSITMKSSAFAPYLYLLNGSSQIGSAGNTGSSAAVQYKATFTGTLTIHASSTAAAATGAYTLTAAVLTAPAAPATLVAKTISASEIDLTWTDNSGNETGFLIERKTGAGGTWSQIGTTGANTTGYPNTALTAGTTYYYRVRAYNAIGNSAYSPETSATTTAATCKPAKGGNGKKCP